MISPSPIFHHTLLPFLIHNTPDALDMSEKVRVINLVFQDKIEAVGQ